MRTQENIKTHVEKPHSKKKNGGMNKMTREEWNASFNAKPGRVDTSDTDDTNTDDYDTDDIWVQIRKAS